MYLYAKYRCNTDMKCYGYSFVSLNAVESCVAPFMCVRCPQNLFIVVNDALYIQRIESFSRKKSCSIADAI